MRMRRILLLAPVALAAAFGLVACGGDPATPPASAPTDSEGTLGSADPSATPQPSVVTVVVTVTPDGGNNGGGGGDWPSPEDCVNYNPGNATLATGNGGDWSVSAGGQQLISGYGGGSDDAGETALALVKHFRTVCYVGRGNDRDDLEDYTLEYWKNPTGTNSPLLYDEDDCSGYNPGNLQVDDTGETGWRVKDHDHPLQHFTSQNQANNGRIVLRKYDRICQIRTQSNDDDTLSVISYF